ncbi:MAG: class E sortase [Ancrocorticia sp.]|uniref:class E sortase n=1 Tax=Ancrocorticia sp. TaxID=2593684 RepID=UPI003F91CFD6
MAGRHSKHTEPIDDSFFTEMPDDSAYGTPAQVPVQAPPVYKRKPSLFSRFMGLIGELMITAGLILGLFVVWQVWWTDIGANRAQAETIQVQTQDWDRSQKIGEPRYDDPPAFTHTSEVGAFLGVMRIPRFGLDYAYSIEEGTDLTQVLDTGAFGHYPDTAFPGEIGNFATAAHRQTYGAPMRDVADLQAGDSIIVETEDAYLVYKLTESYIVHPSESDVVLPVPREPGVEPTERLLTITTCHPPFVSNDRWIVHAEFDHWVDPADGMPEELVE